ncbi:hypothetical protein [Dyella mobilis]|uniref:Uncharacterized protein n=1 Tax=Dyella mobilis TaxID=1849582 RepID=A0ABS2KKA1_9GAMM|nr:hypothetical protein [Dyella mobilis]MBM7131576.1 hypothetical protein [Dyella mobilis]GLQ96451.1 hypothetical protein GCM10007863_08690 [Dyella mobilis]
MSKDILDSHRIPVNRVAARVIKHGVHWDTAKNIQAADQENPIEVRQYIPFKDRNLVGVKFGRLTVIGLSFTPKRWVVRCVCGIYTLRTAKAIRNPTNADDRCEKCRQLAFLKRRDIYQRTGKETPWKDLP